MKIFARLLLTTILLATAQIVAAFELTAEPGMFDLVKHEEDTPTGRFDVSMALTKANPDSKWAASATCGLMDSAIPQNAIFVQIIQNMPTDKELYLIFRSFQNGKLLSHKILTKNIKINQPITFTMEWESGHLKVVQNESITIESGFSFPNARFYCGVASGTAEFDVKT